MKDVAYIALGSNLGQREVFLAEARRAISALAATRVLGHTDAEETAPIGPVAQGPFLNQMIAIETELSPQDLLAGASELTVHPVHITGHVIATPGVRQRTVIETVLFEKQSVVSLELTVPHPELSNRDFWLRELAALRSSRVE